ncbi:MAG: hypothetical protein QM758_30105 [Armatimonas sp.]
MKLGLKLLLALLILLGLMSLLALLAGWLWYIVIAIAVIGGIALAISWGRGEKTTAQPSARTEAKQQSAALKELRAMEKEQERQEKLTHRSR